MKTTVLLLSAFAMASSLASAQTPVYRMNCGGPSMSAGGATFQADQAYTALNGAGYFGANSSALNVGSPTSMGWLDAPFRNVHPTARSGFDAYRFNVASGDYIVRMHFGEVNLFEQGPGLRNFSLDIEGSPAFVNFDPAEIVGWNYAIERNFTVTVTDGVLDIVDPNAAAGFGLLNAVEVFSAPDSYPGPAAVTGFAVKPGYGENILTWSSITDPNIRRFRVDRSPNANGPWQALGTQFYGPPRYLDRTANVGTTYFYRIFAEDHAGQLSPVAGPLSSSAVGLGASPLRVYELTVDPADLTELSIDPLASEEVPGTFVYEGVSYAVSVRYRGSGSRRASKKSWKIKFDPPGLFEGRQEFNLKANFGDSGMIREQSIRRLHKYADLTASEHQPIHLQINGVFRGVFDQIEQIDEDFLMARGREAGDIYKAESDFKLLPTAADYELRYPKKTNESTGYGELISLIQLINDPTTTLPELADRFDLDGYLDYLAIVSFLSDNDQLVHNYFLLNDVDLERWEWITWDNDSSFSNANLSLDWGTCPSGVCSTPYHRLRDWVYENDALRWRLVKKIEVLLAVEATPGVLGGEASQRFAEISFDAPKDIFKGGWELDDLFLQGPTNILNFINNRTNFLATALPAIQPSFAPSIVWINEFMASNETTIADSAGEFDDWIELFNSTNLPVGIGGMYLTDDIGNPTQWQIPAGTTIPAFGHVIIWADDDAGQGPLHANFKLSGSGEEIALFDTDGSTLLDFYHYRPQVPDVSEGRIRSGTQWFGSLPTPSPGTPNVVAGNLPPRITFVQATTCNPDATQSVEITCLIRDDDAPVSAELFFAVNGGAFSALGMADLGSDRFGATIPAQAGGSTVEYYVEATDAQMLTQTFPFGAPGDLESFAVIDVNEGMLSINEFSADNDNIIMDPQGEFDDYLELYNATASTFDLSNVYLTDNICDPLMWQFPAGTTIAPGGTLLVWTDSDEGDPGLHTNFSLSKGGEIVGLYEEVAGAIVRLDVVTFGPQESDIPSGLMGNGGADLYRLLDPTPGASNLPPQGGSYDFQDRADSNPIQLAVQGTLQIGTNVVFAVDGVAANQQGFIAYGFVPDHRDISMGVGLLDFSQARRAGYFTNAVGNGTATLSLPNATSLIGLTMYVQAVTATEGWSHGVAFTIDM